MEKRFRQGIGIYKNCDILFYDRPEKKTVHAQIKDNRHGGTINTTLNRVVFAERYLMSGEIIPKNIDIAHKDGDYRNNDICNLIPVENPRKIKQLTLFPDEITVEVLLERMKI